MEPLLRFSVSLIIVMFIAVVDAVTPDASIMGGDVKYMGMQGGRCT